MLHSLGQRPHSQAPQTSSVDLTWLGVVTAEHSGLEHLQTGDGEPLTPPVHLSGLL